MPSHRRAALALVLVFGVILCRSASAAPLYLYTGPDAGPDGLALSDFSVEAEGDPETGGTYLIGFTLTNSPEYPGVTFTDKGLFIAARDPAGNLRRFESSHQGETLSPGASLRLVGAMTLDMEGVWTIWPSYEMLIQGSDVITSVSKEGPEEWHSYQLTSSSRHLPDLIPQQVSLESHSSVVGVEVVIRLAVENVGGAESPECAGAFYVGSSLESSFTIPTIDVGGCAEVSIVWVPPQQGVYDLVFHVDYWGSVAESDEQNNMIEDRMEVSSADTGPPVIVAGPRVANVTQSSAIVYWETDGPGSSTVKYGASARAYSSEESEPAYSSAHRVQLTGLEPSTTYHFAVVSVDEQGGVAISGDQAFQTEPPPDEEGPRLSMAEPSEGQGAITISAEAQDDAGVEKVEFYLDDVLVYVDYSPPYSYSVDTSAHESGVHRVTTQAFDYSGKSASQSKDIELPDVKDKSAPTVSITFPQEDDKVSGNIQVMATLSDDKGLGQTFFRVDGVFEAFKGYPANPKGDKVSFTWGTSSAADGRHRLSVEVFDKDAKYGYDTVDVWVSQPPPQVPPKLKVKSHTVTRQGNYFTIGLTVENVGGSTATNVVIQDFLRAFQPISGDDAYADYLAGFTPSTMYGDVSISSKVVIHPGQSYTYTYQAVPVLVHPESDYAPLNPSIGNPVKLWYESPESKEYHEEYALPVPTTTNGEAAASSYYKAVKSADYLIVTNPQRLSYYSPGGDVDELLSAMARLARYRSGALGYSTWKYAYYDQVLHGLLKEGGSWSGKMMDGWTSNGFLLMVGETEIIPSWSRVLGTFETTAGDYTWKVVTDNPYANTYGDEKKPELNVARIIGGKAKELRRVIETSLNVLLNVPGYGFDRSKAILVSGFPSSLMGGFDAQVNAVADAIKSKSPTTTTDKVNTPDYAQYSPSTGKMNEAYTDTVVDNLFFGVTQGRGIIYLAGHGNWDHWDKIDRIDVSAQAAPFGWANPFVFASSCKTGTYSGVPGLAEAFLQRGAAVYLGATESGGWTPYSTKFFESWDQDEPISQAVKQVKAGLGDGDMDRIWSNVYHVYGDAKFGAAQPTMKPVSYQGASTQPEAPTRIDVEVPDVVVTLVDGGHIVTIPGGYVYSESGYPAVPTFKVSYAYPRGCQIQGVEMTDRSPPVAVPGLNISGSVITLPVPGLLPLAEAPGVEGWWPDRDYEWSVSQGPEGATLTVTVYPFFYNTQTREANYHKLYGFTVDCTVSSVRLTRVATDKQVYGAGEPVMVDVEIENTGEEEDVVFEACIVDLATGEVVDGLGLRSLRGVKANASYACSWDSAQHGPGGYSLVVELRSLEGLLLDTRAEGFTLGGASLEVASLVAEPGVFQPGEDVRIRYGLRNSGGAGVAGAAVIMIYDSGGDVVDESSHEFAELPPAESLEAEHVWGTSGATGGVYRVVCYALYGGGSTPPAAVFIGSDDDPPAISPVNPLQGGTVRGVVGLQARVDDGSEVAGVAFSVRAVVEGQAVSLGQGLESMQAQGVGGGVWLLPFNTTQVPDGEYSLVVGAVDAFGNVGEESVTFSVANAPVLSILTQEPGARLTVNGEEQQADPYGYVSIAARRASYTVEAQAVVELSVGSRALFAEWEDGSTTNPRTVAVSSDTTLMARYRTQHLLTIESAHGYPAGGGWYDEGSEAVVSVESPVGLLPRHVFAGWRGEVDEGSPGSVTMDGPRTVEAVWGTDHTVSFAAVGTLVLAGLGVLWVRRSRG